MIEEITHNVEEFVKEYFGESFKFRTQQKEAIIEIIDTVLNKDTQTQIVQAPTGAGKSLINIISAGVLNKYYNKRSFILASDLSLWDQYADFINKNPRLQGVVFLICLQDRFLAAAFMLLLICPVAFYTITYP